jgi:hypothetical protein
MSTPGNSCTRMSAVIPMHNAEHFIADTVGSALDPLVPRG